MRNTVERFIRAGVGRIRLRSRASLGRAVRLTIASVAAFVVAQVIFPDTVPILAPLTALLVVEITMKDIVTSGIQRIASVTSGVLLAVAFSAIVGLTWWSLGILIAVSILVGQVLRLGPHMLEVPISAMLLLAVGGAEAAATDRITETLLGAAVGVAVNILFPPAVRATSAAQAVHRFASDLSQLLSNAADELREPITEQQALRWMDDARDLSRHVPGIDKALQDAEKDRQLNPRALVVPDTNNRLRADLDALEHTTVAVRSMFRSILDGVRDNPTTDPSRGEDIRLVFAALLGDVAAAVQAFGDLARAEGTDDVETTEVDLNTALASLREARDRIDDLQLIDPGTEGGWELSEPVRQTVERVLRDLDLEEQSRRRKKTKTGPPRVDPLEIFKSAHQLWHAAGYPVSPKAVANRRAPKRREPAADQTGPHRLPLSRPGRVLQTDSAIETGRLRAVSRPAGRASSRPAGRS